MTYRAPLVLACDGVSARLALSVGIDKRDDRPMGVAVRRYYTSPRTKDDYLESHLQLWDRSDPANPMLLPGYGWIFGMGDGTVNVGPGHPVHVRCVRVHRLPGADAKSWVDGLPEEWGFTEENATGRIGGAALPMGFNRTPHYRDGLLLVGDAGGMVNPFNGEGIGFAMEIGEDRRAVRRAGAGPAGGPVPGARAGRLPGGDAAGAGRLLPPGQRVLAS